MSCPAPPGRVRNCPPMGVYLTNSNTYTYITLCDDNGAFHRVQELCDGVPTGDFTDYDLGWEEYEVSGTPRVCAGSNSSETSVTSVVPSANSDTVLLGANPDRRGASIFNASNVTLYLKFSAGASSSSYTIPMVANSYYEVPFGYVGQINGRWASVNGDAYVTEFI